MTGGGMISGLRSSNELSVVYGGVMRPSSIINPDGGGSDVKMADGGGSPTGQLSCEDKEMGGWLKCFDPFAHRGSGSIRVVNMCCCPSISPSTLPISNGLSDCERGLPPINMVPPFPFEIVEAPFDCCCCPAVPSAERSTVLPPTSPPPGSF